jgi:tetratricopeptide (TPR) repeat protein
MKSKKKHKPESRADESKVRLSVWENIALGFCVLLLLLLWVTAFFPEKRLWGINHWAYFPLWLRTVVIVSLFLIFIPPVNKRLQVFFKPSVVKSFSFLTEKQKHLGYLLMPTAFLLLFYLFRTKTHLLGDGFQILDNINAGALTPNWSQPLAIWIYVSSYHLLNQILNLDGAAVYALVSYLAGIIYVIFALKMANLLGKSSSTRLFIFLLLILMGSFELFFGYAEHYPLFCSGILIYLFYSLKYLRGETKIYVPLIIFSILLPLHFSSLYLFPSILFLFLFSREEKSIARISKNKKTWVVFLFMLILFVGLFLYIRKYNWFVFSYFIPILHGGYAGPNYTLFSSPHILDFMNQQILISPVCFILFLIFLIFRPSPLSTKHRAFQFLLIASFAQLLFNFLINPGLGAPRDWDLFASVGMGYTILALYLFSQIPSNPKIGYLKLNFIVVALLFIFPWILINAKPDMSVARFKNLLDLDPKKSRNGHFILAGYFDRIGKADERDKENQRLKEDFPEVEQTNQGLNLLQKGVLDQAYQRFMQAIHLFPDFAEAHAGLARYYFRKGNLQQSEMELKKTLELKPDYWIAYADLGDIYMQKSEFKKAEKFYNRSIKMGADNPNVWNNMGILYAESGNPEKAISFYQKALAKDKNFVQSHYGLAFVYCQQGKLEESWRETNLLLQINPNFALGYYQLGLIYEKQGRKKEAASAYQRYLELQPSDTNAGSIRILIEKLRTE